MTEQTLTVTTCRCGDELTDEEILYPGSQDAAVCDECYREHYQFVCHWCENYEDREHECAVGSLFALFRSVPAYEKTAMRAGIYRITKWPIYWDGVLDAGLYAESFEWVSPLPDEWANNGGYADSDCGPLCRECCGMLTKSLEGGDAP